MAQRGPIREYAKIDAGTKVVGWQLILIHQVAQKQRISASAWIRGVLLEALEKALGAPLASFDPEDRAQAATRARGSAKAEAADLDTTPEETRQALALFRALKATGQLQSEGVKNRRR